MAVIAPHVTWLMPVPQDGATNTDIYASVSGSTVRAAHWVDFASLEARGRLRCTVLPKPWVAVAKLVVTPCAALSNYDVFHKLLLRQCSCRSTMMK